MTKQPINVGTSPDDGTGDTLRAAFTKANSNFDELYVAAEGVATDIGDLTDDTNLLFDGNYDSLINQPSIPSDLNEFTDADDLLTTKDHLSLTNRIVPLPQTSVEFEKLPNTSPDDVFDLIDTDLSLTRDAEGIGGQGGGIYNRALETEWSATISPQGTEWNLDGWDNLDNVKLRFFEPLREVFRNRIGNNIVGSKLVMHDTINDKYYKFEFSQWQQGADHNGSFAYTRELIDTTEIVGIEFPDGSVQVSAAPGFRGFREIFLGDTSQYDIQPKDAGKYIQAFNTTLYVPNEDQLGFANGDYVVIVARNGPVTIESRDAATIYNPNGTTDLWIIPARTAAFLIKTDVDVWNLSHPVSGDSTGDITFSGTTMASPDDTSLLIQTTDSNSEVRSRLIMSQDGGVRLENISATKPTEIVANDFTWEFNPDGTLTFPDGTTQETALTSSPTVTGTLSIGETYTATPTVKMFDIGGTSPDRIFRSVSNMSAYGQEFGPSASMSSYRSSPANGDAGPGVVFRASTATSINNVVAEIATTVTNVSNGSEQSELQLWAMSGGSRVNPLTISGSTVVFDGPLDFSDAIVDWSSIVAPVIQTNGLPVQTRTTTAVPATSVGVVGDTQGAFTFDGSYAYYCTGDYDGSTDIWKRVAWSGDTWS